VPRSPRAAPGVHDIVIGRPATGTGSGASIQITGTPRPAAPPRIAEVSVVVVMILLGVLGALFLTMAVIDIRGRHRRRGWVYLDADAAQDARQIHLSRAAEAGSHPHLTLLPPVNPGS
jgi:hypothetical protein